SIDTGGPGTYSQLLLLRECMCRLASDLGVEEDNIYPADHFDIMAGVGFGGVAAITLGLLRMTVDEAIEAVVNIASAVFPENPDTPFDTTINSYNLKEALEDLLLMGGIPIDALMYDKTRPSGRCKVVLYAATSASIEHPQAFRTYQSRGPTLNPTIVEALCATMSIPSYFIPTKIGLRLRQQCFVGGAMGTNNPTRELLREANAIYGKDTRVAQILSLGAGRPRNLSLEKLVTVEKVGQLLTSMMADCEMVARELSARLYHIEAFLRLNVEVGMEDIQIDDWCTLGHIDSQTRAYIDTATVAEALELCVKHILYKIGNVTLGQLSACI
ncbi:hypothetical protein M408DRAFT_69473, partial [Serendipita vermifera MAFF 305830]